MAANPREAAYLIGGKSLADKLKAGDGVDRPVHRPYQRVEMDAHVLNGLFCILIPHPHGGHVPKIVRRLWVIVIVEVYSRAVLGYYLSLHPEVNKEDVLKAIRSALTRWQRRALSMGRGKYEDEAALPSRHSERYVGLCWDETSVDGSLAETCKTVKDVLRNVVGSVMVDPTQGYAARRLKDDRPYIETFFRTLGEQGLNRMSNSTGSKPSDKRGRNPEQVALNSQFQLEYLEDLLDVLIANYNATEHAGLAYRSPLQTLDFATTREEAPAIRRADASLVSGLLSVRKMCTVKGGYRTGRRPYVNFYGASYSGEFLIDRHDLVGTKICVTSHLENDARVARASTASGHSLGILRAAPPWHGFPHSLAIRSAIRTLLNQRKFRLASGGDAVAAFLEYVELLPGKKLPPHPAYLDMRRIMEEVAQRRQEIGRDDQVEMARGRLAEGREFRAPLTGGNAGHVAEPLSVQAQGSPIPAPEPAVSSRKSLPMHRMAASE
ncbi:hypothetical protein CLU95_6010 [Variovorax sp. 54]|uniref:hypothetical protein n=1 Tax=Variovorax sp. 54 TaxID=2035212 RepID=UPI000C61BBB5|nr:hypothetical protein [Variovorax sp. 54]PIF78811.1 hypothetical protein CLU95_6010 [Variovorax sp. 54]